MDSQKVLIDEKVALGQDILPSGVKAVLSEFLKWYEAHYSMPFNIEIGPNEVALYIYHDITGELKNCVNLCVEKWKKRLNSEDQLNEFCHNICIEDVSCRINEVFCGIRNELTRYLDKYGIKYRLEEGWEGYARYLSVFTT